MSDFPTIAIPTPLVYDGFDTYSVGDEVGVSVGTNEWQVVTANTGVNIDSTIYVPGEVGPVGGGAIYRKEEFNDNQWAVYQAVIPFDSPDSALGVRMQSNGDGYYLNNVFYGGENAPSADTYFHFSTVAYSGITPYEFYPTPQLVTGANEILMGELGLYRVKNGQSTLIGYWANFGATCPQYNGKPLCWLDVNLDGIWFMLEAIDTNPVKLRVSIIYGYGWGAGAEQLPTYTNGIMEIGTVTDSSADRFTTGKPGVSSFGTSAGAYFGFNAGNVQFYDLISDNLTFASNFDNITLEFGGGLLSIDKSTFASSFEEITLVQPPGLVRTVDGVIPTIRRIDGSVPDIYTLGGTRWN